TKRPAQRKSVLAWQHEIEEDKVDPVVGQDLAHRLAIRCRANRKAILGQCSRDEVADLAMVVDDQDVRRSLHSCNIDQYILRSFANVCRIVPAAASDTLCHKKPYS